MNARILSTILAATAAIPALAGSAPVEPVVSATASDRSGARFIAWATNGSLRFARFAEDGLAPRVTTAAPAPLTIATSTDIRAIALSVDDDANQAAIAWRTPAPVGYEIHAQLIEPDGSTAWGPTIVYSGAEDASHAIVADGFGGAYVAFGVDSGRSVTGNRAIEVRRVAANGRIAWGLTLAATKAHLANVRLVPDGDHGVIAVCEARVLGNGVMSDRHLVAQRIAPSGRFLWGDGAVFVPLAMTTSDEHDPVLVPDGGGVIAVWEATVVTGSRAGDTNIAAQRLDADGRQAWGSGGAPVWVSATTALERHPSAASDGAGGIIVAFEGIAGAAAADIWAQRVTSDGSLAWGNGGLPVVLAATSADERTPCLASLGSDAIAVGYDSDSTSLVTVFSPECRFLWPAAVALSSNGATGRLLGLAGNRSASIRAIVARTPGSAFVVEEWVVTAAGVDAGAHGPTAIADAAVESGSRAISAAPNPFNAHTNLSFRSHSGQETELRVFNALGQTVRTWRSRATATGWQNIAWDGRDDAGLALASGTYLYAITGTYPTTDVADRAVGRVTLAR